MKVMDKKDIPENYDYYRSHSSAYFEWIMKNFGNSNTRMIERDGSYGYVKHYFFGSFSVARFEKCDIEPTRELLLHYGMKRGIIFWSGWRNNAPTGGKRWLHLGYMASRQYHHSTRSAFCILGTAEYWKKWSSRAQGSRKKIQGLEKEGLITIDTEATYTSFVGAYQKTALSHSHRSYFLGRQKFLSENYSKDIRIYLAYVENEVLAGAIFLDDHPTSTYLIAFQDVRAKPYHLGLAILDRWFEESYKMGYKYLDLDHMKDTLDSSAYQGYTDFKSSIADHEIEFHDLWVGWM